MATIQLTNTRTSPMDKDNMQVLFSFLTSAGDVINENGRIVPKNADLNALATTVGQSILEALTQNEINTWISSYQTGALKYAQVSDIVTALRNAYSNYTQWELCKLSSVLVQYYQAGAFTASQFQSAFGLTPAQWTTLSTKVSNYAAIYNQAIAALGQ
jgi:hypothetical protein